MYQVAEKKKEAEKGVKAWVDPRKAYRAEEIRKACSDGKEKQSEAKALEVGGDGPFFL